MKFLATLTLLASIAAAAPVDIVPEEEHVPEFGLNLGLVDIEARQSTTANDLQNGSSANCPAGILIFARGSTESGNLVCVLPVSGPSKP